MSPTGFTTAQPATLRSEKEHAAQALAFAHDASRLARAGHNDRAIDALMRAVDHADRMPRATPAAREALRATSEAFAAIDLFELSPTGCSTLFALVRRDVRRNPAVPEIRPAFQVIRGEGEPVEVRRAA